MKGVVPVNNCYQLEVQKIYLARVYRRQVYNIFIENKMEMKLEVRVLVHVYICNVE